MQSTKRKFGIELEFECTWEHLKKHASTSIKEVYGPWHTFSKKESFTSDMRLDKWHIKIDGLSHIAELTTPVSTMKDLPKIHRVIELLSKCNMNPSPSCGFHIHIDISDIDAYHFMAGWLMVEKSVMLCVPKRRRVSHYCSKIIDEKIRSNTLIAKILEQKTDSSHHHEAISLDQYESRGTVEIRIAEGTDDCEFVSAWTKFMFYLIEYIKGINPSLIVCNSCNAIDFQTLIPRLRMDIKTKEFIEKRYARYK